MVSSRAPQQGLFYRTFLYIDWTEVTSNQPIIYVPNVRVYKFVKKQMFDFIEKDAKMRALRFVGMRLSTCLFDGAYFCTIPLMCNPLLCEIMFSVALN